MHFHDVGHLCLYLVLVYLPLKGKHSDGALPSDKGLLIAFFHHNMEPRGGAHGVGASAPRLRVSRGQEATGSIPSTGPFCASDERLGSDAAFHFLPHIRQKEHVRWPPLTAGDCAPRGAWEKVGDA